MRESQPSRRARKKRHNRNTLTRSSLIIPDGWSGGRKAELKSNRLGDWVLIEGEENHFCIVNRRIINLSPDDKVRAIEDEVLRIYDLLLKREQTCKSRS